MVRETFPEFCTSAEGISHPNIDMNHNRGGYTMMSDDSTNANHNSSLNAAKFSDEEDEQPVAKKPKRSKKETKEPKEVKETNDTKNGKKSVKGIKESNAISSSSALSKSDLITQIEEINNADMRSCLKRLYEDKYVLHYWPSNSCL